MPDDLQQRIRERYDVLVSARTGWTSLWADIGRYCMPRRSPGIQGSVMSPTVDGETMLFDTTMVMANMTLANGQLAWMSPMESAWFAMEPQGKGNDESKRWLSDATDAARETLATSNFYEAVHEFYLDRGAFGTGCLFLEPGRKNLLNCRIWPVGTYVIDEDDEGNVDTVIREFTLTARQAVLRFGEDKVHAKIKERVDKGGSKAHEKLKFLHAIYPREDAERDKAKLDDVNMPVASIYIDCENQHVCHQSGYEEMPCFVSRYLEWGTGLGGLYGWSPSFAALPEARQVNFLQKMMDALAEKMAFPPVLAPDDLEGEIDGNANGVTYFSRDLAQANLMPREWMTAGRYDVGLNRIEMRQQAIKDAFHVDLFQMFARLDKQMTAREVAERSQEKLIQFSPTFARLTTELFNPLLERVFGILLRSGRLGEVPTSMIQDLGDGRGYIAPPKILYSSRISLALRSLPTIGYSRTLERLGPLSQLVPSVLDNFDFDFAERETAMADGVPADFMRSQQEVDETRQARAEAEQAAQEAQQAAMAADAASKLGRVPGNTPVGKVIESQIQGAA